MAPSPDSKQALGTERPPATHEGRGPLFLGIDLGSVSLNLALLDARGALLRGIYRRTHGQPLACLREALREIREATAHAAVLGTGSGRPLLADRLGLAVHNEIAAHAWGAVLDHPEARTIIEIGGQDSKLILLDGCDGGRPVIAHQAMNEICAAGTGSFLDQQAARLGVDIDGEFGDLATRSRHPAALAARCSVFAKSDMIHLQQQGYPTEDILAGLCHALARGYLGNLARGRPLEPPVLFQGGVAANRGVVRAFEHVLGLGEGGLLVPQHFGLMGAIGAARLARASALEALSLDALLARVEAVLARPGGEPASLPPLRAPAAGASATPTAPSGPLLLGLDVGSVSTSAVALDASGSLCHEVYLPTGGNPLGAVSAALSALRAALGREPRIAAVGVTGSGRGLVGDFVGADLVVNEVTAQARAACEADPQADTVFEIGGQDSKFIRLRDGAVVDFEMNKVCAAGTGAFLAEQAARLGIDLEADFAPLAFEARRPVDLGSRCTVFMESDLVHHQQHGASRADLVAGLAYAIARNYLEKVVGHRPVGQRVLFQGGVASNPSVVAAFESLLDRPLVVPPHNRSTGAIGAALLAAEQRAEATPSAFRGFDLDPQAVESETFQCRGCANRCEVRKVAIQGQRASYYGSICGKYDAGSVPLHGPDLFAEREALLLEGWLADGPAPGAPTVGIPRALLFHELFPEWCAFFQSLGYRVVLSEPTSRRVIHESLRHVVAETCLPVKVAYGHVADLVAKGVERVFLPAVVEIPSPDSRHKNYTCPWIQTLPTFVRSAFPGLEVLAPEITAAGRRSSWRQAMGRLGRELGHSRHAVDRALGAARTAQRRFHARRAARGRQALDGLPPDATAVVVLGRPYNACDQALSLQVARKLRQRQAVAIPVDFLPLDEAAEAVPDDVVWRSGRDFLAAASLIAADRRLHPLLLTSFGCGPDAFLLSALEDAFAGRPFLALEVDEHSGDAGAVTRCEAFLHECRRVDRTAAAEPWRAPPQVACRRRPAPERVVYLPNSSEHSLGLRAALRSVGIQAELLPAPDSRTEALGRRATMSRGCIPLLFFAGDALRMPEMPGFRPERAAFFCPGNDEACKVSQFPRMLRRILDRAGLGDVALFAPYTSMEAADAFRILGPAFERRLWRALVAIDLLGFKLLETRPYETQPGEADAVFAAQLDRVADAVGRSDFLDVVAQALEALDGVPTDRSPPRPVVGLSGEHYVQTSAYANNDLVRQIEALGGQVWMTPFFTDYLRVHGGRYPRMLRRRGELAAAAVALVRGIVQRRDYARLERLFEGRMANCPEPSASELYELAAPYLPAQSEAPIVTQVAKAADFIRKGAAGIVHVVPLGCMMSTAAAAAFPQLLADHPGVPILTLIYDCLQGTNQTTRLQAFMDQVLARRRAPLPVRQPLECP
ncbi:MAG: acyl-CoA dehydratase activase [Candidatus Brocadiia bacterium]